MKFAKLSLVPLSLVALAACGAEDPVERNPAESIIAADELNNGGTAARVGALGMTEAQLLDADLVTADGTDLGDVEGVRRNAEGAVEALVVELENTDPDRYVLVPIDGLSPVRNGDDVDIVTQMTAAQLAALPDAPVPTR